MSEDKRVYEDAMNKAKIALMTKDDSAFFAVIAFNLRHIFDKNIPTAGTNGKWIKYNPEFFMSLTPNERLFLIIHETMHCAYLHMTRGEEYNSFVWNCAADYVINLQLVDRGFEMPKMGLLDRQYANMHVKEVYDLLINDPNRPKNNGLGDDLIPCDEGEVKELNKDMEDIMIKASMQSKMSGDRPGTIPGDIDIYLTNLLNPKLPWQQILSRYVRELDKNDYSFRKPNRRFFPKYHLPSLHSESLMDVAIAVDTSASVTDYEFNVFIGEITKIFTTMKPKNIALIQFDTAVKSVTQLKGISDLKTTKFTGRGGTAIEPVIEEVNKEKPKVLLVFTDGYFNTDNLPTMNSNTNTIWIIHDNAKFVEPFGNTINYDIPDE